MKVVASAAAFTFLLVGLSLQAQEKISLTDFESSSLNQDLINPSPETDDIFELKEKILLLNEQIKALTESIITSNCEAEIAKKKICDLQAHILLSDKNSTHSVETKLLQCINQLNFLDENHEKAKSQLLKLSEAIQILTISSTNVNAQARASVEEELRKTSYLLNSSNAKLSPRLSESLQNATIISVEPNLGLIVANIGKSEGVKIGMPFQIYNGNKKIGNAKVIDTRQRISGLMIQNLILDNIQPDIGDILKVDAQK